MTYEIKHVVFLSRVAFVAHVPEDMGNGAILQPSPPPRPGGPEDPTSYFAPPSRHVFFDLETKAGPRREEGLLKL